MTTMNNEDPADPSVHEQHIADVKLHGPRVLDAPDELWLVYGELDHDDTHANLRRAGDVEWSPNSVYASDVRYVRADLLAEALESAAFYRRRCAALGQWQSRMRDPERVIVCDILANGKTLTPAGSRYDVPELLYTADQMRDAVAAERERRGSITPKWWKCPTHGAARPNAWGCPECVREMRSELDALRKEFARLVADCVPGVEYHPAYTADQMRAATAAMRAQDSEHRSAQAAVYAALGPGADPDRATWPDQIRALRERADVAVRLIADVADIAHAGGLGKPCGTD